MAPRHPPVVRTDTRTAPAAAAIPGCTLAATVPGFAAAAGNHTAAVGCTVVAAGLVGTEDSDAAAADRSLAAPGGSFAARDRSPAAAEVLGVGRTGFLAVRDRIHAAVTGVAVAGMRAIAADSVAGSAEAAFPTE